MAAFLVELELGGDAGFFEGLVHELAVLGNHTLVILGVEEKAGRRVRGDVALTGNGIELLLAGILGQQGTDAAVAEFGMLLRDSPYRGESSFDQVLELAQGSKGADPEGYRSEFIQLVKTAQALKF